MPKIAEKPKTTATTVTKPKSQKTVTGATATPNAAAPKKTQQKAAQKEADAKLSTKNRPVIYEDVSVKLYRKQDGNPLTAAEMKQILGWEEESENVKFGSDYLLVDENGVKVRAYNNLGNRPFTLSTALQWKQEVLQRRWKLNGETIIVGKTAQSISAQHRGAALILATQAWEKEPERYPQWTEAPYIDAIVVFGIDEDDATVNTVDTGKPRDLTAVIYRSSYFSDMKSNERKIVARMTDYAVRQVWDRTGVSNAFGLYRTHAESLDFIARHDRLLKAVKHVFDENDGDKIKKFIAPGYAAGLMFLMGCSTTHPEEYHTAAVPQESMLDWTNWDKAQNFWVELKSSPNLSAVRSAMGKLDGGGTRRECMAILIKAWLLYAEGKKVTADKLALHYIEDEDGIKQLAEHPVVGGIDIGRAEPDELTADVTDDPTPEQIEERKAEVRQTPNTVTGKGKTPTTKAKGGPIKVGEEVWVREDDEAGHWKGTLTEIYETRTGQTAKVKVAKGFARAGDEFEADYAKLSREQPAA